MTTTDNRFDVAIVGGGVTGVTLALGLQHIKGLRVALVDAGQAPSQADSKSSFDQRTIALSQTSLTILEKVGVDLQKLTTSPIQHIHVSDKGHAGQVRLHASDYNLAAFGSVVSLSQLGYSVYQALGDKADNLSYLPNTRVEVENVTRNNDTCCLKLHNGTSIQAKLIVIADGGRSNLAEKMGFVRQECSYQQTAITCNLAISEHHNGWAYERFTEQGPLALLPLDYCHFGVVWTIPTDNLDYWLAQSDTRIKHHLQAQFGYRCGIIERISDTAHYPLTLKQVEQVTGHRCVVVGNAAQTLHPIAGQGVNLGFRDVSDLIQAIRDKPNDCGDYNLLHRYRQMRKTDRQQTISATDTLVSLFSNSHLPLAIGRNLGLTGLNLFSDAKREFALSAMGNRYAGV